MKEHQKTIHRRLTAIATVEQRRHILSLPVQVGSVVEQELTPKRLKQIDDLGLLVLINCEGGVGKTCIALPITIERQYTACTQSIWDAGFTPLGEDLVT